MWYVGLVAALGVAVVAFGVALLRGRRYDLIDAAWGVMFIAIAWAYVAITPWNWASALMAVLVSVWGGRLAWHIFWRWARAPGEDRRYSELRQRWLQRAIALQVFVRIYLVQVVLAVIIALPIALFIAVGPKLDWFVAAGALVWLVGVTAETVADAQLKAFKATKNSAGKIMSQGLWRYSRHPNYFGEMLLWWGIGIMGLGQVYGFWGLIGPVIITLLLRFVSGVPPAEKSMAKKAGWQQYKARTPAVVPWRLLLETW